MIKAIITEELNNILIEKLSKNNIHCDYLPNISEQELSEKIYDYDILIIRSKFSVKKDLIDKGQKLKIIGRLGAGTENIDVEYARSKSILCLNSPEGNKDALAEHALGILVSLLRNINIADKEIRTGIWQRNSNRGTEICGKTVGIIGYGNMGSAFAQRLSGFNAEIIAFDKYKTGFSDKYVKEVSLKDIFEKSDIISLHVPLTDETLFMVDSAFINKFQKNIYIINTARGKVIKTSDLVSNIKSGKIKGAALDVLEYEKTHFENIYNQNADFEYLINSNKIILTPHIAGRTTESEIKLAEILADKIIAEHEVL